MPNLNTQKSAVSLPHSVWPAEQMPRLEREAADALGLTLYALMQRAGEAAWRIAVQRYPHAQYWLILCGHGNNGGDGYVIARLAQSAGKTVTLLAYEESKPLPKEAK